MEQYHIFHCTQPTYEEISVQPREYVGFVEAKSLEDAFIKSQNLTDEPWNPLRPCRSTSVGDVIQANNCFFMVLRSGFEPLTEPEENDPLPICELGD